MLPDPGLTTTPQMPTLVIVISWCWEEGTFLYSLILPAALIIKIDRLAREDDQI